MVFVLKYSGFLMSSGDWQLCFNACESIIILFFHILKRTFAADDHDDLFLARKQLLSKNDLRSNCLQKMNLVRPWKAAGSTLLRKGESRGSGGSYICHWGGKTCVKPFAAGRTFLSTNSFWIIESKSRNALSVALYKNDPIWDFCKVETLPIEYDIAISDYVSFTITSSFKKYLMRMVELHSGSYTNFYQIMPFNIDRNSQNYLSSRILGTARAEMAPSSYYINNEEFGVLFIERRVRSTCVKWYVQVGRNRKCCILPRTMYLADPYDYTKAKILSCAIDAQKYFAEIMDYLFNVDLRAQSEIGLVVWDLLSELPLSRSSRFEAIRWTWIARRILVAFLWAYFEKGRDIIYLFLV